ncbi:MAG TPA: arginine decarboxylase, pyruvoyl-dependent [Chloroflexota bacterium]|nr:arginine decarboxylase, pyruvoyl-dependent [Chloroflexota bacterium]
MHTSSPHIPNAIWASAGAAEGDTELNAFDNALLAAQVGNLNLIRVSSVLPQDAAFLDVPPQITPGALVPTVYAFHVSDRAGDVVAAAVGIGVGEGSHGMIYESHGNSRHQVEENVRQMIHEGFARRGLCLKEVIVRSIEHKVERIGCAVAAVVLWWR